MAVSSGQTISKTSCPGDSPRRRRVLVASIPSWVLFFQRREGLFGVVWVAGRWEAEQFAFPGRNGSDEFPEVFILAGIRVVQHALPVVVRSAECEFPYVSLPLAARIIAGGMLRVVVKNAHRTRRRHHGFRFAKVQIVFVGDKKRRCLVGVDIFEIEPEVELCVGVVRCRRRQQRIVAVIDMTLAAISLEAWIPDERQSRSIVNMFRFKPALRKVYGFRIDDGVVQALFRIREIAGFLAVIWRVISNLFPRRQQSPYGSRHLGALCFRQETVNNNVSFIHKRVEVVIG